MSFLKVKVKYHNEELIPIKKLDNGDWVDLRASEDVVMQAGDFKLISLGISIQAPSGYELNIVPRSSTYKNFGIIQANHFGIVDESYNGNNDIVKFPAIALRDTTINLNDRICQFRLNKKQPGLIFETVSFLGNEDRGGFGSTGVN
jgi:dUTP pyrophosphatase